MTDFLPCGRHCVPPSRHGNRQEWADGGGFETPARDDLETAMKKNNAAALVAAAMALAVTLGPARAADVPRVSYGAAAPYQTYNWIGPYIGANDTFAAWKFSNPWFGTLRGRAGYAMNNVLLYATFGLAYGGGSIETA